MDNYTRLKDQGNQLFKEKKFTQAIEVFQSAIELMIKQNPVAEITSKPDLGQIYVIINTNAAFAALSLKDKQHYKQAERYCSAALTVDPQHQRGLYRRALANKELAELLEIESNGTSQQLLALYNKAKKDLEDIVVIDRTNEIAKQKLSQVVKNIYRVTVTQGKQVDLSGRTKIEQVKPASELSSPKKTEVVPNVVKKSSDMNKILKEYRVQEVTSIARTKIEQQYLTQQLPKNRAELEKAIRQTEKSKDVFVKFVYRFTDEYLKKIQPTFDMLFKMIQIILDLGEGQQAKQSLWVLKNQKAFDLLWKGYTNSEKTSFKGKWEGLGLDLGELK